MLIKLHHSLYLIPCSLIMLASCSVSRQIAKEADAKLLKDTAVNTGFIGISIYDPSANKYLYNYNATKNFIPASNTKLFTLYAGMKYLGDSLTGIAYQNYSDTAINVFATGDPTFLHTDFTTQPVLNFLEKQKRHIYLSGAFRDNPLGKGWAWDDYNDDYMAERSPFPIYGNTVKISISGYSQMEKSFSAPQWVSTPAYFKDLLPAYFIPDRKQLVLRKDSVELKKDLQRFYIQRGRETNHFLLIQGGVTFSKTEIPFTTNGLQTAIAILNKDHHLNISEGRLSDNSLYPGIPDHLKVYKIKSQPSDSLFKPMMHRSDNFFAEQTLLMASNERLGYMDDNDMIDTLLTTDLKDVPQRPKWVDGSGLSRYNLFTPQAFIYILNKMRNEFGWNRLKTILPTGGEGTLKSFYKQDSGFIYAKTGTLSNNCSLSGFLLTKGGKWLIFSILANHYQTGATPIRQAVERFLSRLREKY
jgi:D-alanyl-D-alanine carboxypeptidase/D-alanyl-D-alanine-endopeptidase (penicillin-binding protein 4)